MDVVMPIIAFLIGFALGGGALWFLLHRCIEEAREQERQLALADNKASQLLIASKEAAVEEHKKTISLRDNQLAELRDEISALQCKLAILQTTLTKEHEKFDEKLKLVNDAEKHFKDTFKALASDALKENNKEFDNLAKPVRDTLKEIDTKITVVNQTAANLGNETGKLVKALQKPEVRGQWGEMHLLRVVEVTGMTDRCDFHEQQVIGEDGLFRPDLVVHLPGDKNLAIDAKAPIRAFLDAAEEQDEESRCLKQKQFVLHIREHVRLLGSKAYHQSLVNTPEFVVLYLPTEAIFSTALALDGELLEYAAKYRVHLAGPSVLITLMRSVAYGWKQQSLATHAKEICQLADELYKRLATFGSHMAKVGASLNRSVTAFNQAVGSLESRVMPQARKFEQLGAAPDDIRIQELVQVESVARNLQCEELLTNELDQELLEAHEAF